MQQATSFAVFYTRPDWVRRVNAMGDSVGGAAHLVPLDAAALERTAIASTGGLSDFSDSGCTWRSSIWCSPRIRMPRSCTRTGTCSCT